MSSELEREALVAILEAPLTEESQGRTFSEMLADVILVRFGFRRTEVPEPSGPHCDGCAKYAHHHCYHCGKRASLLHPTWCPNFTESAPGPQGQPSDAQNWNCGKCDREEALGHEDEQIPTHHRSCQADAKLLAAANAYTHYQPPYDDLGAFSSQFLTDMRAALRAAGGVR